jgi:hypothetical protein
MPGLLRRLGGRPGRLAADGESFSILSCEAVGGHEDPTSIDIDHDRMIRSVVLEDTGTEQAVAAAGRLLDESTSEAESGVPG